MNDEIKSLEEDRKHLLTLINQLQKEKDSLIGALTLSRQKYNNDKARYRRKYKKIRKNWNSLREWLEERKNLYNSSIADEYKIVLDKMNELEGKSDD